MTIDVLLPTYNRSNYALLQIQALQQIRHRLKPRGVQLRVVVSDNQSTPAVELPAWASEFARVVRPENHLGTAEENIFFGLRHCDGEYVWLLGDDDPPIVNNAVEVLARIADERPAFAIANASGGMVDGTLRSSRTNCAQPAAIRDLPDFIRRTGFKFVLAGISCIVFRRELTVKRASDFAAYFEISKIYSLAFWFADVFWTEKFSYYAEALVVYKQNKTDLEGGHWARVAKREGFFENYPWTLGWARLFARLQKARGIETGFLAEMIEQNWTHRFPAVAMSLYMFLNQLDTESAGKKSACREMSDAEKSEYLTFLHEQDPRYLDVYTLLPGDPVGARQALNAYLHAFFNCFFVRQVAGWNVYRFDEVYRALPARYVHELNDELTDIAPRTSVYQLVGATMDEVVSQIELSPYPKLEPVLRANAVLDRRELDVLQKWARLLNRLKRALPSFVKARLG